MNKWLIRGISLAAVVGVLTTSLFFYSHTSVSATSGTVSVELARTNDKQPATIISKQRTDVLDVQFDSILYKNKWLCSYETIYFSTPDNDIDIGQYALDEDGAGYYIRTRPKGEAQFDWVDLTYDISGLTEVKAKPKNYTYYDEFLTAQGATELWTPTSEYYMVDPSQLPSGCVVRIQSEADKYKKLGTVPNEPQPERTETVDVLPPPEPTSVAPTHHSVAFDATSNSGAKSSVSSYSWSHTCTGDNLLLAFGDSESQSGVGSPAGVTTVTYNAVNLTYIRTDARNYVRSTIYYLIAPDAGAHTVAVTLAGTVAIVVGGVVSYTGAKQSGQPDAHNGANNNNASATVSVTTIADNCWVFDAVAARYDWSISTCDNTQRWQVNRNAGGSDTNAPKTPAGAQAMSWTLSGTDNWAISAASFAPAVEAAAPEIGVLPITYGFGVVAVSTTPYTATNYFTLSNNSTMQTDMTIAVTTENWTGGIDWIHSDTATAGANTAGLLANRGGTWETGDIIVKFASPNFIYENCPASTNFTYGLKLLTPTSFNDGVEKEIIVRISAVAG